MTEDNKRACIITFYPGGGIGAMTSCFVGLLKELGFQVSVYYFDKIWNCTVENKIDWDGIQYNKIPYFPVIFIPMMNYFIPSLFLNKLLNGYALCVSISGSFHTSLPYVIQRKQHISKVATTYYEEQRSKYDLKKFNIKYLMLLIELKLFRWANELVERLLYRSSYNKAVMVDSEYTKELLLRRHGKRNNLSVFPYCVNTDIFKPRDQNSTTVPDKYIFACSRFDDGRKNLSLLLEAFAIMKKSYDILKDTKLIIAGFEPVNKSKYLDKYGPEESIIFLGRISEDEKIKYYQGASIFVLPSRQEGLGIVVLEAMACGVPVVSTRCGGPESIIEDGINGLFAEHNAKSVADNIVKILLNPQLSAKLTANGLKTIKEKFSKNRAIAVLNAAIKTYQESK